MAEFEKGISAKKKNVRIDINSFREEDNSHTIQISTTRLISKKGRKIVNYNMNFSIETIHALHAYLTMFFKSRYFQDELKNEILPDGQPFSAQTNIEDIVNTPHAD